MKIEYAYKKEAISKELDEANELLEQLLLENGYYKVKDGEFQAYNYDSKTLDFTMALYRTMMYRWEWFVLSIEKFKIFYGENNEEESDIMSKIDKFYIWHLYEKETHKEEMEALFG